MVWLKKLYKNIKYKLSQISHSKKLALYTMIIVIIFFSVIVFLKKQEFVENGKTYTRYIVVDQIKKKLFKKTVSKEFTISIKKIDIKAPIITGVNPGNKEAYNQALKNGVVLMDGTPLPGTGSGNTFIFGHSSALEKSSYDKIFLKLNDLENNDNILINYNSKSYTYKVIDKKIVEKNDLSVLDQTEEERVTLMTCWPIGTDKQRLIIVATRK